MSPLTTQCRGPIGDSHSSRVTIKGTIGGWVAHYGRDHHACAENRQEANYKGISQCLEASTILSYDAQGQWPGHDAPDVMEVECGWQRTLVISCPSGGGRRGRPLYGNVVGTTRRSHGGMAWKGWTGEVSSLPSFPGWMENSTN